MKIDIDSDDAVNPLRITITFDTVDEIRALYAIGLSNEKVPEVVVKNRSAWTRYEHVTVVCETLWNALAPYAGKAYA